MGGLADKKCIQGQRVSGILVKRNFNYHIMTSSDLSSKCVCMGACLGMLCVSLTDLAPHVCQTTQTYQWEQ